MTGAMDRPMMKNLMGADRRLPICFSLLSNPSVHPFERINCRRPFPCCRCGNPRFLGMSYPRS